MKPECSAIEQNLFLYNQNTNFHLAQCFRTNPIYGVWCSDMQYAKQASELCGAPALLLILHSSGSGLWKQVLGCPLCHWRRRPLRSSGVRSIIHREGSTPESQGALADVVSDSGGKKKASHFHRNARWWIRPCPRGSGTSEVTFSTELFPNHSLRKDWNPCQLCLFAER